MRKNERTVLTTRSNLIWGHRVAKNYALDNISKLEKSLKKAKAEKKDTVEIQEKIAYWKKQTDYHVEEIRRLQLTREVCGDPVTVIV